MEDDLQGKLREITGFEWDPWNIEKNKVKHRVLPKECEDIFFNKPLIIIPDTRHSFVEERYAALGITDTGRVLTIIFTFRGSRIRVISARDQSMKEKIVFATHSKLAVE